MIIKDEYDKQKTEINIEVEHGSILLWIKQAGASEKETLLYLTPEELLSLLKEIKEAGLELFK